MFQDNKCGIGYGMLGLFQDDAGFVRFDGKKWTFDADAFRAHIRKIKEAGATFIRTLAYGVWGSHPGQKKAYQFQPYVLNTAKNLWDLSAYNTYYFSIVKRVIEIINGLNMTVIFPFFDNCQLHGLYSRWSPWVNNVQGVLSFYGKDADVYSKRWVSTMTLRFKDNDIIWAFGNELENQAAPDFIQRVIFPYIKIRNLDFNKLTYGATTKISTKESVQNKIRLLVHEEFGLTAEKNMMMEDHGWPFTDSLPAWGKKPWRKLYSDDGLHPRPSPSAWAAKAAYILSHYLTSAPGRPRLINFEHLPDTYPIDTALQVATIKAIKKACEGV